MRIISAIIINLLIFSLCFSQNKIKNIFDPNNVKSENSKKSKITKNFDFVLYGIINTENMKKVLIKPKVITSEVRKRMGKSKYVSLKVGEEFQNIKLISIDNDTAKFKKGDKIIAMRVFQNTKNDRVKIATKTTPTIINNAPVSVKNHKKNIKNKNNFIVISPKSRSKLNKSKINHSNKTNKKVTNPFLELLKKARQRNQNNTNSPPPVNPFLELLRRGRR